MIRKLSALFLVLAVICGVLAGCTTTGNKKDSGGVKTETGAIEGEKDASSTESRLADEQILTFVGHNDMITLDVSLMNDEMSALVMYAVNEALIRYSKGKIIPGIAERYEVSDDGTVYTFHLRDAKWSDGEPVTAYDFEYAYLRLLSPDTGSSQIESFSSVLNAMAYANGEITDPSEVGIKAADEKTLVITLAKPDPFFLEEMAQGINFYPIRKDYVEKYGKNYGSSPETFIGCGPFVLTEWSQGSKIVMEKNPLYWDADNIVLEKVVEYIVGDENTRVGMYDLGEVDGIYSISAVQTVKYSGEYGTRAGGTLQHLVFMSKEGAVLSNKNLRLALSYAIDRESIVKAISPPGTVVADSMIDPEISLNGESIIEKYPASSHVPPNGDPEKAKEYLNAALSEMGLSSPSELPEINYVCLDSPTHRAYAEALQAQWKDVLGVNVNINIMPVPQAIGSLLAGEFDIFLNGMSTGVSPDTLLDNYTKDNPNNYAKWSNDKYTELMNASTNADSLEERFTKLQQAHQLILDECAVAPLWLPGTAYLFRDYVDGLYYGRETGSIEFIYARILAH
jgi:oligopeptide transport system substrate-binding protein